MKYNHPKLFYKTQPRDAPFEENGRVWFKYPIRCIELHFKSINDKRIFEYIIRKGEKRTPRDWNENSGIIMEDDEFNKYFSEENFESGSRLELLKKLNIDEYKKLLEQIDKLKVKAIKVKGDSDVVDVINEEVNELITFKKEFISWFNERDISIPKSKKPSIIIPLVTLNPMELGELNKKQIAEYYIEEARKDIRANSHLEWKNKFLDDIGIKSMYPTIKRLREKFKKEHPEEKFNINGMAWYNKS